MHPLLRKILDPPHFIPTVYSGPLAYSSSPGNFFIVPVTLVEVRSQISLQSGEEVGGRSGSEILGSFAP